MLPLIAALATTSSYVPPLLGAHRPLTHRRAFAPCAAVEEAVLKDDETVEAVEQMNDAAILLSEPGSFKPTRGPDGRLKPILTLPGDTLETTTYMKAITAASTVAALAMVVRAFMLSSSPLSPLLALALGGVAGEMFSGTFHWATDNCACTIPIGGHAPLLPCH